MTFNLTRRFALLSLGIIAVVGVTSAVFLSRFLVEQMLRRDGEVTMQFVQGLFEVQKVRPFFRGSLGPVGNRDVGQFFEHLAAMPDMLHANVYGSDRKVLWSSNPDMIGQTLPLNVELDEALKGELVVESDLLEAGARPKLEHLYLATEGKGFVENYVPILDADQKTVLGVVELYRAPRALIQTTKGLVRRVWTSAILGGLVLFGSLFWLTRRADRFIRAQQRQLVETEKLAAVGELATAVAHSIRNPLASIRSSAELARESGKDGGKEAMQDIIGEVDRIAAWIRSLLTYSQPLRDGVAAVDAAEAIKDCVAGFGRELEKKGIGVKWTWPPILPKVVGDPNLLMQAFNSLIANAVEAMPQGGTLAISAECSDRPRIVSLDIADTGIGMSAEQLAKAFVPFHTTKRTGLGVGLPMARRVLERFGGGLAIESTLGRGTTVRVRLSASKS
ncbi:MAG: ATP-binding protein [Burkholderiales bacterium]